VYLFPALSNLNIFWGPILSTVAELAAVTELLVEFFVLTLLFVGDGSVLVFKSSGPWNFLSPTLACSTFSPLNAC